MENNLTQEMKKAMETRHMVRKYTDKQIPAETLKLLRERISQNKYNLAIKLHTNDSSAFNAVIKLILAKGVQNFFVMAGTDRADLDERLGYSGADLMLYAQTLGLNTWWVGGTFNRRKLNAEANGNKVIGIIAVGYGATNGKPHKSKDYKEVATYEGETPSWFLAGVEAALLAPTALNKQAFTIEGTGNKVKMTCDNGIFTGADLGLAKYHFELGAGKDNFEWSTQ